MPARRDVLEQLKRDELIAAAAVADRRRAGGERTRRSGAAG